MGRLLIISVCCASFLAFTQEVTTELLTDVITDPSISFRCKELIKRRNEKVQVKQKTQSLMQTARKLREVTPDNKKSVMRRLERSGIELDQKLYIVSLQIERMEETIIRNGCPGLLL